MRLLNQHSDDDILSLCRHVIISSSFRSNGQFYEQTDDVTLGSPATAVFAKSFMEHLEETALKGKNKIFLLISLCRLHFRHLAPRSRQAVRVP
jgi:hypothetical protein